MTTTNTQNMHARIGFFVGTKNRQKKEVALIGHDGLTLKGEYGFNKLLTPEQFQKLKAAPLKGGYFKKSDFSWLYE